MRAFPPKPLSEHLAEFDCDMDPEEFRRVVRDEYSRIFPGYTNVDRALCEPRRMIELCEAVRGRVEHPSLSDFVICWTLLGMRKKSEVD